MYTILLSVTSFLIAFGILAKHRAPLVIGVVGRAIMIIMMSLIVTVVVVQLALGLE